MDRLGPTLLAAACAVLAHAQPASAQDGVCRVVEVDMIPSSNLQIVVWLEDSEGNYVDTAAITRTTGAYGLGNRPGMMEFKSGPMWPYGRRVTTFPVWAHRHGMSFPLVVFQNWTEGDPLSYTVEEPAVTTPEENLSHPLHQSSVESRYCRPLLPPDLTEPDSKEREMWDTQTCATTVYTDKGKFHPSETSLYPPRSDLVPAAADSGDMGEFASLNPFDQVSLATPPGGDPFQVAWRIPDELPEGDYVLFVEVSKEGDVNEVYDRTTYSDKTELQWGDYGISYLGQPSVIYQVPFTLADTTTVTSVSDYAGYGDPDGIDGEVRAPDMTITTDVPGSGAARLMLQAEGESSYRVRVTARNEPDYIAPGAPGALQVVETDLESVDLTFVATGDDGDEGVANYQVRYQAGQPITEDNWTSAEVAPVNIEPSEAGLQIDVTIRDLLPQTNYYIGVRAIDECLNEGPITTILATTPVPLGGEVDACFVATAAYGSFLAADVGELRRFRDVYLRSNVVGELLVEAYYTFGPSMAEAIEPSDLLRAIIRRGLAPVVSWIKSL